MAGLVRDWLLDPVALLFLTSMFAVLALIITASTKCDSASPRPRIPSLIKLIVFLWFLTYFFAGAPIVVNPMVNQLEQKYASVECEAGSHVVLLSGGVRSLARSVDEFERMLPATFTRATAAYKMMMNESDTQLIVSGGVMRRLPEATVIGNYLTTLGLPEERLILETESENTYANAVNVTKILIDESIEGPVRIVSSAMHMHRALSAFELALKDTDIEVCPVSVDYLGLAKFQTWGWIPKITALTKFYHLIHEIVALGAYRAKGWI